MTTYSTDIRIPLSVFLASKPRQKSISNQVLRSMITARSKPDGNFEAYLKGAPEIVLSKCEKMRISGETVELGEEGREWFRTTLTCTSMAGRGERCLGLAYRPVDDADEIEEDGYIFKGILGMLDPPRPEVPEALLKVKGAGVRVFMLTGDFGLTAR